MKQTFTCAFLILLLACGTREKEERTTGETKPPVKGPAFAEDSAFAFVQKQVAFGPRIPNSAAHRQCGEYLIDQLKSFGAKVQTQDFQARAYDGTMLSLRNIIASFQPENKKRILLAAHWDTRPFADKDPRNPKALFDGANDGASGVGVLLEVARTIAASKMNVGVDIILFDGEDWGEPINQDGKFPLPEGLKEWWCLGSQHWSKNKHQPGYSAYYGILLDMVGAKDAQFHREGVSMSYAPTIVEKVWSTAERLGYGHVFVRQNQPEIIDDHVFVNQNARIPMIDIVHFDPVNGYFGNFHHATTDNLSLISPKTLDAVGTTLLQILAEEAAQNP